jgi:polysaccharide export outer membrane protein
MRLFLVAFLFAFTGPLSTVSPARAAESAAYTLGSGDKIRVTVYDEKDLSGDYDVNDQGFVALPLIGQVPVGGKSISDVEKAITSSYAKDYLVNPRVSVEVLNYRPFFILGEVNKPNSYPYVSGMTVIQAVTLGGGYTPRADRNDIHIKHVNRPDTTEQPAKEDTVVLPGDTIRVGERLF